MRVRDSEPIAWFPMSLDHIATHPAGRAWAGVSDRHLYIISLEGVAELARQEDTGRLNSVPS